MAGKKAKSENWLIFVDTNIYLDFYRSNGPAAERQLKTLEKHIDSLIISEQVWMEFLKNRQAVTIATLNALKTIPNINVAPIAVDSQPHNSIKKNIAAANKQINKLTDKIIKQLERPEYNDPVYQSVKRIFKGNGKYNLKRPNKLRYKIRRLASKRCLLGYPPRKSNDNSIGDAINWEWIIHCAANSQNNHNILIVSRDGDFGPRYKNTSYLNDWLLQEFKDRISRKRKILLTDKLTDALQLLDEKVTKQEILEEESIIEEYESIISNSSIHDAFRASQLVANHIESSGIYEAQKRIAEQMEPVVKAAKRMQLNIPKIPKPPK